MLGYNTVHLIPTYKTVLKRSKPQTKTVKVWTTSDSIESLKGCIFHEMDVDNATETVTDSIKFCVDNVIPQKEITVYPNNKPYN